jgi:signal transduction histidine kinase/CheY-like chemotaxis protein
LTFCITGSIIVLGADTCVSTRRAETRMAGSIRETIKNSGLFWVLSEEQVDKLASLATERTYAAGQRIFTEGEPLSDFFIVAKGKVSLEIEMRIGSRTRRQAAIDVVGDNGFLGWSTFLNLPATMSGTAIEPSHLLVFDGEQVRKLCSEDTDLGYKLVTEMVRIVSQRLANTRRTLAHVLSVTSHDLRAPLATVQSSIDVVVGGFAGEVNQKQKELLLGGKQRIADLLKMIDNILDISYIEIKATDFQKVDLRGVVAASIGDVEGLSQRKAITIKNNVSRQLSPVLGAQQRLQQVLTNLLSNGVKFTPNGGCVTVSSSETADKIQIDVADTGVGVPPEDQPKLFSDFFRGGRVEAEGAGLGLAISKKIVEGHGGSIWVQSPDPETGKGTRFSFTLPKVLEAAKKPGEPDRNMLAGADILVTDDDPEMRRITSLILESRGYKVRTAQDGEEALERINEKEPDVLVLDLLMPRMDGFEVCKRLEERKIRGARGFPVIILSAVREESSRRRYELETEADLDVDDYVTKPISPPLLLQKVEKILLKRRAAGATRLTITKGGD